MKKKFDNFLENLSEIVGEEQAKKFDEALKIHEENNIPLFLENCLNYDFQLTGKQKRKRSLPLVATFTMLLIFILFTGGRMIYHFAFEISEQDGYGEVQVSSVEETFHYIIPTPEDYTITLEEVQENSSRMVCTKDQSVVIFIESVSDIQIDIENIQTETVFLNRGYQAFYYEKNGFNLYWQQGKYFYYLYTNDPTVNLIDLASSAYTV